jgi:CRISPR/Cas system-associated endonuclease Cas1
MDLRQSLYLTEPDTRLDHRDRALIIHRRDRLPQLVPIDRVDRIVLIGTVPLKRRIENALIRQRIALLQLDTDGSPLGRWHPPAINPQRDHAIAPHPDDRPSDRAAQLLDRYLRNAIDLLDQLIAIGATPTTTTARHILNLLHNDLDRRDRLDTLRSYYDTARRYYDRALHQWLAGRAIALNGTRPRIDTRTALRFAESLLLDDLDRAISRTNLDPNRATLHATADSTPPLTHDAIALLRATWVDRLVAHWLVDWANRDDLDTFLTARSHLTGTLYRAAIDTTLNLWRDQPEFVATAP